MASSRNPIITSQQHELIGQCVNLVKTNEVYRGHTFTHYEVDDPAMERKLAEAFGEDFRYNLPGSDYGATLDFKATRANVAIDPNTGVILAVTWG